MENDIYSFSSIISPSPFCHPFFSAMFFDLLVQISLFLIFDFTLFYPPTLQSTDIFISPKVGRYIQIQTNGKMTLSLLYAVYMFILKHKHMFTISIMI